MNRTVDLKNTMVGFIVNPAAGKGTGRYLIDHLTDTARQAGIVHYTVLKTSCSKNAHQCAEEFHRTFPDGIIAACGGDGTINEILQTAVPAEIPLWIIPCGTANVAALELELPLNPLKAVLKAASCPLKPIDIIRFENRYFLLMAGIGFDAQVIRNTSLTLKKYIGKGAYAVSFLKELFCYREPFFTFYADSKKYRACRVIIQNFKYYGGRFHFFNDIWYNDGTADIVIFKNRSRTALLKELFGLVLELPSSAERIRAEKIVFPDLSACSVHLDCEPERYSAAGIEVMHNAIFTAF